MRKQFSESAFWIVEIIQIGPAKCPIVQKVETSVMDKVCLWGPHLRYLQLLLTGQDVCHQY